MFRERRITRETLKSIWNNIANDDTLMELFDMRGIDSNRITLDDIIEISLSTENEFELCTILNEEDLQLNKTIIYRFIKLSLFELLLLYDMNYRARLDSTEFVNDLIDLYKDNKNDDIDIFDIEAFIMYLKLNELISEDTFNKLLEKRKDVQKSDNDSEVIDKYVQDTMKKINNIIDNLNKSNS